MTCLQAFKLGAQHTMLAINRADYIEVLDKLSWTLGLELAVSPRVATANEILRYIGKKSFIELEEGNNQEKSCIIELDISSKSSIAGKRIRDINWPDECVIVGQESNYNPKTPTGDDIIQAGDSIIAIISKSKTKELLKLIK